jgi:NAD(P)-dependent dehydrogenase (short-subunit alcohol dehydrogenase family)
MVDGQKTKNALVVGGTSGLGLNLACLLRNDYYVSVTGRKDPEVEGLDFRHIDLNSRDLSKDLDFRLPARKTDLLVYSAGFYQEGLIDELSDEGISEMISVGLTAPALILQRILRRQDLPGFIAITSTSQTRPRLKEPIYCAVKAGLGMLAHSLSLDSRIGKVLVAAPAGMNTPFWKGADRGPGMIDPAWVAEQVMDLYKNKDFSYMHAYILRADPAKGILDDWVKIEEIKKREEKK